MKSFAMYQASLCISSNSKSAQGITNRLQIQPVRAYEKGSPLSKRNPTGRLRDMSSWILDSDLEQASSLEAHVEYLVSIIESKNAIFRELAPDCKVEIYCSFFAEKSDASNAITFSSSLLKRLTVIPVDITIVCYPPDKDLG